MISNVNYLINEDKKFDHMVKWCDINVEYKYIHLTILFCLINGKEEYKQ